MSKEINEEEFKAIIGSMVESIENENFIRTFTPEEQLDLGISIQRDLNVTPYISEEAIDLAQNISNYNNAITEEEVIDFVNARGKGKKL